MDTLSRWFTDETGWNDAVLPDYFGGSVANIPATLLQALRPDVALPSDLLPPLDSHLVDAEALASSDVIVLLIIDGFSRSAFEAACSRGFLSGYVHRTSTLTSVFPSTTSAALTSLHHGVAPARHGMAGYTLFLPAQQRVVNMVKFKPVDGGAFHRPPPDPARMTPSRSFFEHCANLGVEGMVVSHQEYATSPLTKVHSANAPYSSHRTQAEFAALLRQAARTPGRRVIIGYWAGVDLLAHTWGVESEEAQLEIDLLGTALRRGFLEPLAASGRSVAVLLTSDHGHCTLQPEDTISIAGAMRASGGLLHATTGERRALGLSFRKPEVGERTFRALAGSRGVLLPVADAVRAGLYGPPPVHPELLERVGQYLLLARGSAAFANASPQERESARGAHGSLTADEMLVPLVQIHVGATAPTT